MKKSKMKVDDIVPLTKSGKPNKNYGNRMKSAHTPNSVQTRDEFFTKNIPTSLPDNPADWVDKHIDKQQIQASLELEYQLKFGDDKTRKELALEYLGMRGHTKQSNQVGSPVPAVQLIMNGSAPWTQLTVNTKKPELVEGEVVKDDDSKT